MKTLPASSRKNYSQPSPSPGMIKQVLAGGRVLAGVGLGLPVQLQQVGNIYARVAW
jgi:hypothetical protein